jgi:hypothetical protein
MILLLKLLTRKRPRNKLLNGFYYDHKAAYIAAQAILINNPQRKKRVGLPFSEKKIIPRNTEQTDILIHSIGIPFVSRKGKCSEFLRGR